MSQPQPSKKYRVTEKCFWYDRILEEGAVVMHSGFPAYSFLELIDEPEDAVDEPEAPKAQRASSKPKMVDPMKA